MQQRDQESQPKSVEVYQPRRWPANLIFSTAGLIALVGFGWLLWAAGSAEITSPMTFITQGCLTLFLVVVAVAQFGLYWSQRDFMNAQWNTMERGLERTDKMIDKMQGQLEAINKQEGHLSTQAEAAKTQAKVMQGQLDAIKLQEGHMQTQSEAVIGQLRVMQDALKANRDSVDLAWEGLKTQKRAYLGTNRMNIDLTARKRLAIYLTNVGKSPATSVTATLQVTISTPVDWHKAPPPENVRIFALGEEEYKFNLTAIYPDSIPVRIGFPLGKHFTDEELALVVQKKSRLTVNLSLNYQDGFDDGFAYFKLTYRGKDSHGYDSWGIFPTESEKEYDQANPDS